MKKLLFVSLFLSSVILFSQKSENSVISADNMNIFYLGVENPVSVSVPNVSCDDLSLSVSNGSIKTVNKSSGNYMIMPNQSNSCVVSVFVEDGGGKRKISSSVFRVKHVPMIKICPKFNSNKLSKSEIIRQLFTARIPDFEFPVKFSVSGFSVICVSDDGTQSVYRVKGNKLSSSSISGIMKLRKGDRVIFKDFLVRKKDGLSRSNVLFTYVIK